MTRLGGAFKYPQIRSNYMRRIASASTPQRDARRALLLVSIMLLASAAPILTLPGVSAHQSASDTIWPQEGSNDTGWVQLDAIGANGVTGAQASASWTLEFAPGAELSNVSFQVRVNGSDGLMIEEPMLVASDVGVNLLDWRGLGMLGSHDSFTGPNPYSGRLSPNSDSGATWTLPSDAEITELIIEALTPVDPVNKQDYHRLAQLSQISIRSSSLPMDLSTLLTKTASLNGTD